MMLRATGLLGRRLGTLDVNKLAPSLHKRSLYPFTTMAAIGRPTSALVPSPCTLTPTPCAQRRPYSEQRRPKLQFPPLPREWEGMYKAGQMYTQQDSLPRLPVPPLHQTLDKYLKCVQPLISEDEFEKTKVAVAEFGKEGGAGEELQRRLLERAKTRDSWLIDWWNHVAYLGYRLPVMVHSSPAIGFPRQPCGGRDSYVKNAARMLLTCVKWNLLIQNEAIPVDYYRKKPMCMHHYQLYSKCRIPGPTADTMRATPIEQSRHVIIIRNGYFYKLNVMYETPDGTLAVAPSNYIMEELHKIVESTPAENKHLVGILTNEHRDRWYEARERLRQDPVNQATLDDIETAVFTVSLDRPHPHTVNLDPNKPFNDYQCSVLVNNILHGNGSKLNSGNRWSDTCIQLCINEDGGVGSLLEHTGGDGPCAIAVDIFMLKLEELGYDVLAESSPVPADTLRPARLLEWNISADSAKDIETAVVNNDKLSEDVDMRVMTFPDFGKNFPKKFKLSPDGFIQTAIQLAYWKLYKRTSAMYESGATRWFKYGRTETIRSTSNTSHKFLKTMSDPTATVKEKADLLVASVQAHTDYTIEAISGEAVDRHLLGLRLIAVEAGMELPGVFTDPAYGKSLHFHLSTSQVPVADFDIILCFGAVVPDGYGVCYNPQEKKTLLTVSSFRSCPDTDTALFLEKLQESFREMRDVLEATQTLKPKL